MLRGGKWLTGVGVGFLVLSLLWLVFAVPALVRYPLDVDATPIYEGKFTLFVDANTFAPLDTPQVLPLKVTRHIDALGSKSSYSKVVVSEKIDFDAGGQFSQKQDNQYVMDRRSMKNVQSDDAYAFTSDNVVDRSPAFRLNFPLDTDANSEYLIYKNETASTYTAGPDPVEPKLEVDGLHLVAFAASSKPTPISPAYIALLSQSVPLPKTLTITQLTPLLLQAGIDVPGTLTALQPVITPEDLTTLTKLASQPIALQYLDTFSGGDAVEPTTGAIVVVHNVVETVSATAAPEASQPIVDVLGRYPQVPEAKAALEGLNALATNPIPLFRNEFSQTDASIKDIAGQVKDQKDKIDLAKKTVPTVLVVLGVVAGVTGLVLLFVGARRSRRSGGEVAT
jgi:Porin PorA